MDTGRQAAPHGSASRYNNGSCRCAECKAAWAEYIRDRARQGGRRSRSGSGAAKRLGLTRLAGEDAVAYKRRMRKTRAWLRGEPYYADRSVGKGITVHPTELGLQLLQAAQARTGRDFDDLVEHMLRHCAPKLSFDEGVADAGS